MEVDCFTSVTAKENITHIQCPVLCVCVCAHVHVCLAQIMMMFSKKILVTITFDKNEKHEIHKPVQKRINAKIFESGTFKKRIFVQNEVSISRSNSEFLK